MPRNSIKCTDSGQFKHQTEQAGAVAKSLNLNKNQNSAKVTSKRCKTVESPVSTPVLHPVTPYYQM